MTPSESWRSLLGRCIGREHVAPGVQFIIVDCKSRRILRRGTFTSAPLTLHVEGIEICYAETEPDPNHGLCHVYFGDAGIAQHPDGRWNPSNITVPAGMEAWLSSLLGDPVSA